MIDLRSDTVTRPTHEMRRAIANAEVGDAVIDIDPTTDRLERLTAEMLGKEAAIFMPSGSMTNQVAIRIHCGRGTEFICEAGCHIYNWEQAAFAQLSGVVAQTVLGNDGVMVAEQLHNLIRPENDHMVRTSLVCLENTHNRAGGRIQPPEVVEKSVLGPTATACGRTWTVLGCGTPPQLREFPKRNLQGRSIPSASASAKAWGLRWARPWSVLATSSPKRNERGSCLVVPCDNQA